jgi:quinol monooxygenase YgiN
MRSDRLFRLFDHTRTHAEVTMVVVAGHLQVEPDDRAPYLQSCCAVVRLARTADGCLDFALSPDLLDPGRINIFERWETLAALEAFRGSGQSGGQAPAILDADVHQFEVATVETL